MHIKYDFLMLFQSAALRAKPSKHPGIDLKERDWQLSFYQSEKGKIYDKKPFKFTIQEGKKYLWCACGHSRHQVRLAFDFFSIFCHFHYNT